MKSMDKLTTGVAYGTSAGSAGYWFLQLLDKVTPSQWAATGSSGNDGLEGVSYIPYKDIVGVWTVCHGHTGKDIMLGKTYTKAECKALLNKDLATVARQINPYIKVDIPETTRGALYSFVYNVGAGNFRTSTLLRKINQGDIKGACDQLRRWTYAGGKQWKGLMTRREIEREICLWGQQ